MSSRYIYISFAQLVVGVEELALLEEIFATASSKPRRSRSRSLKPGASADDDDALECADDDHSLKKVSLIDARPLFSKNARCACIFFESFERSVVAGRRET